MRPLLVWMHRYAGLAMTLFLVIVGLTGSVLAFRVELDQWLNPGLLTVAKRDAPMLDPFELREKFLGDAFVDVLLMTVVFADHDGELDPFEVDQRWHIEEGRVLERPSVVPPLDRRVDVRDTITALGEASAMGPRP